VKQTNRPVKEEKKQPVAPQVRFQDINFAELDETSTINDWKIMGPPDQSGANRSKVKQSIALNSFLIGSEIQMT